ncbi:MAG TPA: LacI family DNA-binding transcriptional regulator [Candidatus Limiplasma sp.]|nr:LacI family DNA-binding transcriptional regulator [Candidatus Limiplasma sp.]
MVSDISIVDIAKIAKVSPSTVSRALTGSGYVSAETKKRIMKVVNSYDYQPKQYKKRSVRSIKNSVIGIVVSDLNNIFFQQIINSITSVFDQHQIETIICNSDESIQREVRILSTLQQFQVDGIIISPTSETAEYNTEFLMELDGAGMHVILVDRDVKGIAMNGVFQETLNGTFSAINTLISLGHRNIAIIAGPTTSKPGLDRLNGYLDSFKTHSIPINPEYILYGDFKLKSGYELTAQLLKQHPEVTAVFASNNLMALGSLHAIYDAGLSIPDDIAFISCGTLDQFDLYNERKISVIMQPTDMMGEECAKILLERMMSTKKKAPAKRISFDSTLELRGSEAFPIHRLSEKHESQTDGA